MAAVLVVAGALVLTVLVVWRFVAFRRLDDKMSRFLPEPAGAAVPPEPTPPR